MCISPRQNSLLGASSDGWFLQASDPGPYLFACFLSLAVSCLAPTHCPARISAAPSPADAAQTFGPSLLGLPQGTCSIRSSWAPHLPSGPHALSLNAAGSSSFRGRNHRWRNFSVKGMPPWETDRGSQQGRCHPAQTSIVPSGLASLSKSQTDA